MRIPILTLLLIVSACGNSSIPQWEATGAPAAAPILGDTVQALSHNMMRIFQDSKGNHWFASWEDGVYRHDGKTILHCTTAHGLPSNRVEDIQEDKQGNIYLNTTGGITRHNGSQWTTLPETPGTESDWQLHPDDLWFKCTAGDGTAYRWDGKHLFKLRLPPNALGKRYEQMFGTALDPHAVYCVYKDSHGSIWFGTAAVGAGRYNGKTFDWLLEEDVTEMHNGPANGVRSIAEDADGNFWFNANYKYAIHDGPTAEEEKFYTRIESIGGLDGKTNDILSEYLSCVRDDQGHLWFATYSHGAWEYDGKKVTHHPVRVNGENIHLFCIYQDNAGKMWLGTHENGVYCFRGDEFVRFGGAR